MSKNKAAIFLLLALAGAVYAAEKKKSWFKSISDAMPQSDRSAEVTGVRGLEESEPPKVVGSQDRDFVAIEWMESQKVSDADLETFKNEGGLK